MFKVFQGLLDGLTIGHPSPDRKGSQFPQEPGYRSQAKEFHLRHEINLPVDRRSYENGIKVTGVIGGQDDPSLARKIMPSLHPDPVEGKDEYPC